MSVPEIKLWNKLRDRSVCDAKFRRQQPIGLYTADFYCAELGLVVELDGSSHKRSHDERRDAFMRSLGLTVLRIPVWVYEQSETAALQSIAHSIERLRLAKNHAASRRSPRPKDAERRPRRGR